MIKSRKTLIIASLFPIIMLAMLIAYKKYVLATGTEVILPISAYDPRDILAGHYMTYQIDYGIPNICPGLKKTAQRIYICLDTKTFSYTKPLQCKLFIRGTCSYNRFTAGIERYYIPENQAEYLSQEIKNKNASILISITKNGHAEVKDLLLNRNAWQKNQP